MTQKILLAIALSPVLILGLVIWFYVAVISFVLEKSHEVV